MKKIKYQTGSDNVFADIGVPDAEEALAKADLARRVIAGIRAKGITQQEAAAVLRMSQPKISGLMRGRLSGISMERLMLFLVRLGNDVQVVVKEPLRPAANLRVVGGGSGGAWTTFIRPPASRTYAVDTESRESDLYQEAAPWTTVAPYQAAILQTASLSAFVEE
jgi:predicted XRE-type DNA-binding protein